MGIIVVSAIIAHTARHWMIDRADVLWNTPWPQSTGAGLMILARWILAVALAVGAARLLAHWIERKWRGHIAPAENRVDAGTRRAARRPDRGRKHRSLLVQTGVGTVSAVRR